MNRLFSAKYLVAAAVALGAVGAATAAHARTDVMFSIGFAAPAYVEPAPVYVQPAPTYLQPAPVYVQPEPVYVQPRVQYYGYGYQERHHHRHWERRRGPWGDWDGDGVPNRYDHAPGNPYRR